jgi:tetratricopeptide (TPR) repeat protein
MFIDSRLIFKQEIMDWTDNYIENLQSNSNSEEAKQALSAIVQLWVRYATFEITLRQFKKAVQVYEEALTDPIASTSPEMYLAYAEFYKSRGKLSNAQKIFLKGLSQSFPVSVTDKFWEEFLIAAKASGLTDLTVEKLYKSIIAQNLAEKIAPPSQELIELDDLRDEEVSGDNTKQSPLFDTDIDPNPPKKIKSEEPKSLPSSEVNTTSSLSDNVNSSNTMTAISHDIGDTNTKEIGSSTKEDTFKPDNDSYSASHRISPGKTWRSGDSESITMELRSTVIPPSYILPDLDDFSNCTDIEKFLKDYSVRPQLLFCAPDVVSAYSSLMLCHYDTNKAKSLIVN